MRLLSIILRSPVLSNRGVFEGYFLPVEKSPKHGSIVQVTEDKEVYMQMVDFPVLREMGAFLEMQYDTSFIVCQVGFSSPQLD